MSLRNLPTISALSALEKFEWEVPKSAMKHYDADIRAASDENADVISIFGAIGADALENVNNTDKRIAAALRSIGKKSVTVNVNSPGGSFLDGVGIYNLLREHPAEVTVNVMGMAGSAASIIAMAGDKVRIPKSGFIMVHNASGVTMGNKFDHADTLEMLSEIDAAMASVYALRAGVSEKQAAAWMDKSFGAGTLFRGEKAISAGLADELMDSKETKVEAHGHPNPVVAEMISLLMEAGHSRREARAKLRELKGDMPDAVADKAMPDAGDLDGLFDGLCAVMRP